jgi:hypothetical protein
MRSSVIALMLLVLSGCALVSSQRPPPTSSRSFVTTVRLHGKSLQLHVTAPRPPAAGQVIVLYASGDGGWFGAAVDMFQQIGNAGYFAAGFSSRAFLKIERPPGALINAAQLAAEYEEILLQARRALGLDATTGAVLAGWSRGAAFSVLVGSEHPVSDHLLGVIAIGLADGEDLDLNGPDGGTDEGRPSPETHRWPFDTYERLKRVDPLPSAVIQSTHDDFLPAAGARQRFGPDTPRRRFYAVDAKNHRFSGGKAAFDAALIDALRWIVVQPDQPGGK